MSKLTNRQLADAASQEPGFWPNYREPTKLAEAMQMPLADPHWQTRVLNGYAQTNQRFAGRRALEASNE